MNINDITILSVIAWARSKAPDDTFRYVDNRHCFFAQYLRDIQGIEAWVNTATFWPLDEPCQTYDIPDAVHDALDSALDATPINMQGKLISFHMVADFLEKAA